MNNRSRAFTDMKDVLCNKDNKYEIVIGPVADDNMAVSYTHLFLNIDNKKMSKSAGNFFTVREISEKYPLQVIRFFMLSAHYRSPLNLSLIHILMSRDCFRG